MTDVHVSSWNADRRQLVRRGRRGDALKPTNRDDGGQILWEIATCDALNSETFPKRTAFLEQSWSWSFCDHDQRRLVRRGRRGGDASTTTTRGDDGPKRTCRFSEVERLPEVKVERDLLDFNPSELT